MLRKFSGVLALAGLLAGCNATTTPTPAPIVVAQHLYVGDNGIPGSVQVYTLPITAASTAAFSFASDNVVAVTIDANGNAAVLDNTGNLKFFTAPLSAASTPAAVFTNGSATNNGSISFLSTGDFFVGSASNRVNRFNAPFTNASTPAAFVTDASMVAAYGTAVDASQNLYIANARTGTAATCSTGAQTCSTLLVYAPPYTGTPTITPKVTSSQYRKMAGSGSVLYVCSVAGSVSGPTGRVDAYNLPLTAASVPAFAITTGVNVPASIAFDASGNMYVGNFGNSTVTVYAPPFSAASAPSVTLTFPGTFSIFGIAIGR